MPMNKVKNLEAKENVVDIEAEYMVLSEASKEVIWLKRLVKEFRIAQDFVVIQSDKKVHTIENTSDCLTKPITTAKFKHCLSLLSLVPC
ncbi:hypothetical protein ACE6H2_002945 [Prunus campanulata]